MQFKYLIIVGPTNFQDWSYELIPVCHFVRLPVASFCMSAWCFLSFLKDSCKELPNFVEDYGAHPLSQMGSLKEFLILNYRGSSVRF